MIDESDPEDEISLENVSITASVLARWLVQFLLHLQCVYCLSNAALSSIFRLSRLSYVYSDDSVNCAKTWQEHFLGHFISQNKNEKEVFLMKFSLIFYVISTVSCMKWTERKRLKCL